MPGDLSLTASGETPPGAIAPSAQSGRGMCMMSTSWRDKQDHHLINFIGAFLAANSYRLNFLLISPDFIFNNGGLSIAFIFETNWDCGNGAAVFSRVNALKRQYKNLYVFVAVPTVEQIKSFNQSYFKYGMELGCPTFVPVNDSEMGFEMMLKIAHARGVCKQHDISSTMRNEKQAVQSMDAYIRVLTSIPGIDDHDANMVKTREKMADIRVREAVQKAKETEHSRSPNITGLHGVHFTLALTYCILIQNYTEYFHLSTMQRTHRKQNKCYPQGHMRSDLPFQKSLG
ncbi:hypothetical protein ZWY2020_038415 [Hordeum vulgare]|nr:hypothetical protein ZWY2020_038415 [Hordeum vulgare]